MKQANAKVLIADDEQSITSGLGAILTDEGYAVEIAPDGSRVAATTANTVLVWTLALPQTADQTRRWLDAITNAVADTPSGPLSWR